MRKTLIFFTLLAVAFVATACKDEICGTSVYTIVNQIDSDIVVKLQFGDEQVTTIKPGEMRMIHYSKWCRDTKFEPATTPEVLNAEMKVGGEIVPRSIWRDEFWNVDADIANHYSVLSLIVTDELLETVKNQPPNQN
ncbi:MAG: hypothetical protein LBU97_02290 [Alistipes sp.]|nr:hypothetical protein [Alistipes sp.]